MKVILIPFGRKQINLRGKIVSSVFFLVHVQRGNLTVPQVCISVSVVHSMRKPLFIVPVCKNVRTSFPHHNSSPCVLTTWKNKSSRNIGIFQQLHCNKPVVL